MGILAAVQWGALERALLDQPGESTRREWPTHVKSVAFHDLLGDFGSEDRGTGHLEVARQSPPGQLQKGVKVQAQSMLGP